MRVALVTPYIPWPADTGGKLRSYHLIRGLAQASELDLFPLRHSDPEPVGPLGDLCHTVDYTPVVLPAGAMRTVYSVAAPQPRSVRYFQSAHSLRELRTKLARGYDLLVCDEIALAPYFREIPGAEGVPRLVIRHKVDYLHYAETAQSRPVGREKALDWLESRRLRTFEYAEMANFQAAVVCSHDDMAEVQRQAPGIPIEVIVNGADTDYFVPQQRPDPDPTIILMGTMYYYPNIDGVLHYFQTMHEALRAAVPDLRVLIVGHMPPPEIVSLGSLPGVTVTGSVPDVRPWLSRAWVQIVPLRLGGGSRLKIVESMASGVPVVSTTVGAQGLDVSDGVELMLADEPADFVRKTAMLLEDSELRSRMASTARSAVEEKYSWQGLGRRFAEFCADTIEVARARQRQSGS